MISTDEKGMIEYWDPETGGKELLRIIVECIDFPKNNNLKFRMKLETDLFDLAKVLLGIKEDYLIQNVA